MYGHPAMVEAHAAALKPSPEQELRAIWTAQGVSVERQEQLLRQIAATRVSFVKR